jgi:hypothetical protein
LFDQLSLASATLWLTAGVSAASEHDAWAGMGFAALAL